MKNAVIWVCDCKCLMTLEAFKNNCKTSRFVSNTFFTYFKSAAVFFFCVIECVAKFRCAVSTLGNSRSISIPWLWSHNHLQETGLFLVIDSRSTSSGSIKHITGVSTFAVYGRLYIRKVESELWYCGGSQADERSDRTYHNRIQQKRGDKPEGWITASPRQPHCSEIQGWKLVCMCEFACCVCMHVAVKDRGKRWRGNKRVHMWLFVLGLIFSAE